MSLSRVLKALEEFGISKSDANLYIYLAKKGSKKGSELLEALRISKQQLYPSLRSLESRGLVMASTNLPAEFSALPFEKVLDCLIHLKKKKAKEIQNKKVELLTLWESSESEKEN